ncbi:MFS transporter [Acetobacter tropicalis]|uniref:Putative transporter n=1 Tax=Acetobacter tropicalis TaxID=104102 RepID=A0A094YKK8_9PROT|nr:MFS transporter [Acetobacter tropicalis]KGB21179.1 putative transporter [Acetobacter tropicalis]MBC9010076.1 MFS transporter [Acetobacter tropicalis]MDO8170365.1 MFS transporter [Acetobacter tropicalis]
MNQPPLPLQKQEEHATITPHLVMIIAAACGLIVANLYYAQPLAGPISAALGMSASQSGLIVTMTQIGYCVGLLLIVPLADLLENRSLIVWMTRLVMLALVALPFSNHPLPFLLAIGLVGILSVAVQILVPFAAHLAPEARRGQVVGNVMSGLMMGIMLARPVSSFVTQISSWQTIFLLSAGVMLVLSVVLQCVLPQRHPRTQSSYAGLLLSMVHLLGHTPVLQRRAFYHACMFGAFSLFWTVTPLLLAHSPYLFSQGEIALFAFVGVAGAIAAPIAGRVADKGWTWPASLAAMGIASLAFLSTWLFHQPTPFVVALCIAGVMIDFGVTANLVLGQRALFILAPEHRARLNGLYMAIFFLGGAAGSALGAWTYAQGGWIWASTLGAALPAVAFLVW